MIVYALVCAAILCLVWPMNKKATDLILDLDSLSPEEPVPYAPKETKYIEAVAALQVVQTRLHNTDLLDDDQRDAINTLALALTAGSTE